MRAVTVALTVLAAFLPAQAFAGAWTTPEGKMWVKIAWVYLDSDAARTSGQRTAISFDISA